MIKRDGTVPNEEPGVWAALAAPLDTSLISWRQDGRPVTRDGKFFARFVAYVDANTVRERLDSVVPGEWDETLELLPQMPRDSEDDEPLFSFKARLQILGVIREDVGQGRDYKQAATDAFKRAAVRFGIAHELYDYEQNWVHVDGDGKYAKPLDDPGAVYARKHGQNGANGANAENPPADRQGGKAAGNSASNGAAGPASTPSRAATTAEGDVIHDGTGDPKVVGEPSCPKCGGKMWDNRLTKRNPKAPNWKCRSRSCDGVIWPPKKESSTPPAFADDGPPLDDGDFDEGLGF